MRKGTSGKKEKGCQLMAADTRLITPYTSYLLRGSQWSSRVPL